MKTTVIFLATTLVLIANTSMSAPRPKVPSGIKHSLSRDAVNNKTVWTNYKSLYTVRFEKNGKEETLAMDADGNLKNLESINFQLLPQSIQTLILENYELKNIQAIYRVPAFSGKDYYVINIEK